MGGGAGLLKGQECEDVCDQRVHPRCSEMAPDASLQPCGGLHDKCRGSSQL